MEKFDSRYDNIFKVLAFSLLLFYGISLWLQVGIFPILQHWSLIDDTQMVRYLNGAQFSPVEIFSRIIKENEISVLLQTGHSGRFRLGFYLLRYLETLIFGENRLFWYSFRLLCFAVSGAVIAHLLWRNIGRLAGVAFLLIYMGTPAWGELIFRLGVAESYYPPIVAALLVCVDRYLRKPGALLLSAVVLLAILFCSIKEIGASFLIGTVAVLWAGVLVGAIPRMVTPLLTAVGAAALFWLLLTYFFVTPDLDLLAALPWASGIYGKSVLKSAAHQTSLILIIVLTGRVVLKRDVASAYWLAAALATEVARYASILLNYSVAYHSGLNPTEVRYDFPFAIYQALAIGVLANVAIRNAKPVYAFGAAATIAFFVAISAPYKKPLQEGHRWASLTTRLVSSLGELKAVVERERLNGKNPAIVVSGVRPYWEPTIALALYVRLELGGTPIFVEIDPPDAYVEHLYERIGVTPVRSPEMKRILENGCVEATVLVNSSQDKPSHCKLITLYLW